MKKNFGFILGALYVLSGCGGGPPVLPPQPPNLHLSPASLSFGVWVVGNQSSSQTETLTNTGGSSLVISNIAITGANVTDFNESSTCGSSLTAGASCAITVTFSPSQVGPRSASINISDDSVGSPQLLSMSGTGGVSGPNATLSPTSLVFGDEVIGTTSSVQSVTLNNYGTATLSITGITASTNFGQTNACNSTLASGASCTLSVTFTPANTGSANGTLSFADSAPDSPQVVSLSGTGVAGACRVKEEECYSGHPCCPGLQCVAEGNRAFCQ